LPPAVRCPRPAQACPAPRRLPYPEPRSSQPQSRWRAGGAGPAHAADSRPRSPGLSSGPAPGRSRRPLLKDRQTARRTKPARGHMLPRAANLVSRYSGVARAVQSAASPRPGAAPRGFSGLGPPPRLGSIPGGLRLSSGSLASIDTFREPCPRWAEGGRQRQRNYDDH
jgi:hypothetical protein